MDTVLGLLGIAVFIVGVVLLAAAVTYVVVRLSPAKAPEPTDASPSGSS